MPQAPSEERPPTGPTSPDSSNRSPATALTLAPDSRAEHPVDPTKPRRLDLPNLMLLVADPKTGELLPEYQDEAEDLRLNLEPETLVPAWWPHENPQGQPLSPKLRMQSFRWSLQEAVEAWASEALPKDSDSATRTARSSTPHLVLRYLRQCLSALPQDEAPIPD